VVVAVLSLATALPMEKGENEVSQFDKEFNKEDEVSQFDKEDGVSQFNKEDGVSQFNKEDEGRVVRVELVEGELQPLDVNPVASTTRRKRYFEEFFHKKTQEERRQRMEELKQRNLLQQRRRAERREQRRQRKLARRENRKKNTSENRRNSNKVGRKPRDLPRIDCRVRSPAHVVNLLLLIHSQKVRDVVAGRWLEECANKSRPRPSTSLRYFG